MSEDNANHTISQVASGQVEQSDVDVRNVTITSMSNEQIQGAAIAKGTALVNINKLYSARNSREPRTEHWMLSVTYYLNPKQVFDQAKVFPAVRDDRPTRYDHYRIPREPRKCGTDRPQRWSSHAAAFRCGTPRGSQPVRSRRKVRIDPVSYDLILPFFPEEIRTLLMDSSISDLMINGISGVYAERSGQIERVKLSEVYTNARLTAAIERVARVLGQDLMHQNPILNTRLPDGSRVAVVGPPASIGGPTLTIRKFNKWYTSDELVESGSLPREVCELVVSLTGQRKNGIVAGGTGSGKTTLMKALLDHIPMSERLCVIEQPAELQILQPNTIRWKAIEEIPGQVKSFSDISLLTQRRRLLHRYA